MMSGMSGLWPLLIYSTALIALGLWIGRRVSSAGGFFVADRKLGPVLLFATVLAANLGAGTTVGAAGLAYADGLSAWWWVGSAGIGTIALAVWVGPRIWRVASEHGLLTMGDYLDHRYGPSVRGLIAVLLWFATLTLLAAQLIAMAEIVSVVAGQPRWVGATIGAVRRTRGIGVGEPGSARRFDPRVRHRHPVGALRRRRVERNRSRRIRQH